MFTGIVEGKGVIIGKTQRRGGVTLRIHSAFRSNDLKLGASVAVNGCCLTVARKGRGWIETDLSNETLRVTNLGCLDKGSHVNLERPLRPIDRLGGHLVQGHVDGVGRVLSVRKNGKGSEIAIDLPKKLRRYLIQKGSIAVDGVSMTVNQLKQDSFSLFVIPHTLKMTTLGSKKTGNLLNLEVDLVGKYIEKLTGQR